MTEPQLGLSEEKTKELLIDFAKRWLAHDGHWFLAVEAKYGMDAAIEMDIRAWEGFAASEGRRILKFLGESSGGGLKVLERALQWRMYALINPYRTEWASPDCLRLFMVKCRVQEARRSKNLPSFPCRPVGEMEYKVFAETIDPRIRVQCINCPPDEDHDFDQFACGWEFTIAE